MRLHWLFVSERRVSIVRMIAFLFLGDRSYYDVLRAYGWGGSRARGASSVPLPAHGGSPFLDLIMDLRARGVLWKISV